MFNPQLSFDNLNLAIHWNRRIEGKAAFGLWIISLRDSSQRLLLQGNVFPLYWYKDSKWIYAINSGITPPEILKVNSTTGLAKIIFNLPFGEIQYSDIDITSDGKTIVCAVPETNSDVWMIENFDPDVE